MKIIFLCSSLEHGSDGVGDYTRRLACELIVQGHSAAAIALNDNFVSETFDGYQELEGINLAILRLPRQNSTKSRLDWARKYIYEFNPDYISLQFVIYGFHPKGLPFGLGKQLASIGVDKPWHIMFHEVWPGITKVSPLKHKIYGYFQRKIIKSLVNKLNPISITTSNRLYQIILANNNISATILPLFSNIQIAKNQDDFINDLSKQIGYSNEVSNYVIGIFGTLYPQAKLETAIEQQLLLAKKNNKNLIFISFGRIGTEGINEFDRLKEIFRKDVQFFMLGELKEEQVSAVFQIIKTGISCTPVEHLGKSGVFAAMRFHDLNVIAPASDFIPEYDSEIKKYNEYLFERESYKWGVSYIANFFLTLNVFNYSDK